TSPFIPIKAKVGNLTYDDLPDATVGEKNYSATFHVPASFAKDSVTISLLPAASSKATNGTPPGMTFNDGTLSGSPSAPGFYSMIIEATDSTLGISDTRVF